MHPTLKTDEHTHVTVVVCTFNRHDMLRDALTSLGKLSSGPDFGYEIVVVDDGSTDETAAAVKSIMDGSPVEIRYIRQNNRGVAAARNTGVRNARGQWIAFFDDDQLADGEWLVHLVTAAQSTGADCVGGPCLLALPGNSGISLPQTIRRLLGENPVMREELPNKDWGIDPRRRQNAVPGTGNALVRKELFERIGSFSEDRTYGEDLHFFRRARESGARFATAPRAVIQHVIPAHRLTRDYLLTLAGRGGSSQGQIDSEVTGVARALWNVGMRSVHFVLWTIPGMLAFWLLRNHSRVLSKECSARFAAGYVAGVVTSVRQRLAERLF